MRTLPPRGNPDRIEMMAANVARGLPALTGDDGTATPYPDPPEGYVAVERPKDNRLPGITSDPHLRYYGPLWGWWTKGTGPRKAAKVPTIRKRRVGYRGRLIMPGGKNIEKDEN